MCSQSLSRVQLFVASRTVAHPAPLSMEFSRQAYRSGLPFHTPGDLHGPGIEPASFVSPALAVDSLSLEPPGKPWSKIGSIRLEVETTRGCLLLPPLPSLLVITADK